MILTETAHWVDLYERIKNESRQSSEKHISIYASASDADSVCALRIMEDLLKADLVPHSWMAVSRYEEIMNDFRETYSEDDEVTRFVILINCGAAEDMNDILELANRPHVCLIIIDSARPIVHFFNDENEASNVFVLLDESEGTSKADIPFPHYETDSDEDDDRGSSDRENNEGNARPRQRRRLDGSTSPGGQHDDDDDDDDDRDENADGGGGDNAQRVQSPASRRAQRERAGRQREIENERYYMSGTKFGKSSACLLFDLAHTINRDTSYLLWLALVGLTDQYVHNKIDDIKYQEAYAKYSDIIMARGHLDDVGSYEALDGEGTTTNASNVSCRIVTQGDYKFGLLREWTLWDAMVNSVYVASRLQTYTEKGRQRLEFLLAKIGIPLKQARSSYTFDMDQRYRDRLEDKLKTEGSAYNLADSTFESFQLQDGFTRTVMAVDAVHAVTALLESGPVKRGRDDSPGDKIDDHRDRFWRCWHALSWKDDGGELRRGLELAKKVQTALVKDGGSIIVQRLYHNFKFFRMFDLSDHKLGNQSLLAHPMALQRLSAFFQEQHAHTGTNARRRPVVLIGPKDPLTGRCFVVGYQIVAIGQGNRLGQAFVAAAEAVNAQSWHDLFDTRCMEVMQEDVERFKAELLRVASELL